MIASKKNRTARIIFNHYIEWQLKKYFTNFYLCGERPPQFYNNSVLIAPNHISWWDGFFIDYFIRKETLLDLKIMMLESQLKKYWFFRYLGAFSINTKNFISVKESIIYARKQLEKKNNALVIYPQGAIEQFDKRPLSIKKGIQTVIIPSINTLLVPMAFKILYCEKKFPAILARMGEPIETKLIKSDFDFFEKAFYKNLDLLSEAAESRDFIKDYFHQ